MLTCHTAGAEIGKSKEYSRTRKYPTTKHMINVQEERKIIHKEGSINLNDYKHPM